MVEWGDCGWRVGCARQDVSARSVLASSVRSEKDGMDACMHVGRGRSWLSRAAEGGVEP